MRVVLLSGLAVLALGAASASAQDAGGVLLTPQVLNTENAQGRVVDHVFGRLQQAQQLRALATLAGPTKTAKPDDPSIDKQALAQQTIAQSRGDAGFLAGFSRGQALAASRAPRPKMVADPPQPVVVNAYDSPVTIGNNNIVQQQVTSSTSIGGNATAVSQANAAGTAQSAVSNPASTGGTAHATAANSNVEGQGSR